MARDRDRDRLCDELSRPGFTPRRREVSTLVGLLGDATPELRKAIERAVMAHPGEALGAAISQFAGSVQPLRARLVRLVGKLSVSGASELDLAAGWSFVMQALRDDDAKVRRNAAMALGRSDSLQGAEEALLEAWERELRVEQRRTVIVSLGRVGLFRTRSLLRRVSSSDAGLQAAIEQAALMVERNIARERLSAVRFDVAVSRSTKVELRCKPGLETLCVEELGAEFSPRVIGAGRVRATLDGPLSALFRARTAFDFSVVLPAVSSVHQDPAMAVCEALTAAPTVALLESLSLHGVRYRIEWEGLGHQRALTWRCVAAIARRCPGLVNDPRESPWEVVVRTLGEGVEVLLTPRLTDDPRFRYRRATVPAASHPTVAAALARVAGVRAGDVVWDPFVGSGLELAERARLGPYERLHGSDVSEGALAAARQNLDGVARLTLSLGDALDPTSTPGGVTLIVTNPPLGYRTAFGEAESLLERFVRRAREVLGAGGRLVWVVPERSRVPELATELGFLTAQRFKLDLGGLSCVLLKLELSARATRPRSRGGHTIQKSKSQR